MRVTCPSCKATYEVPDALLGGGGRTVRCARCAHEWRPEMLAAVAPKLPPLEPSLPRPEPRLERALRPPPVPHVDSGPPPSLHARQGRTMGIESMLAVAFSVLLLAALGWGAYVWRAELMQAWPPSQRLFAALGLH